MILRKISFLSTLVLIFAFTTLVYAQIPQMINYQGKITDPNGALINTTISMTFTIYDDSTDGTTLWTETQPSVKVEYGIFSVLLGSSNPIPDSVFDGSVRYLGLEVGSDSEMTPRKAIVSVGYAYKSLKSDTAEYAKIAIPIPDNDWIYNITDSGDTTLMTGGRWGIARYGNTLYGNADSTHVNLGVASTTGTVGIDIKYCAVSGGLGNTASGSYAAVGGGYSNTADDDYATVGGGRNNTASGEVATVGGGELNNASYWYATVGGGYNNTASANIFGCPTVGGGNNNTASEGFATVGGGANNTASGGVATVSGGANNTASGDNATVNGGTLNIASGWYATVAGGHDNTVDGDYSFAIGRQVNLNSTADYTFAFGYNFTTSSSHAVVFYDSLSQIKVGIQTTSPTARLDVQGSTGYNQIRMRTSYTPTGTNDTNGNVGDVAWDDDYFYVKTSAGWKRVSLGTW